MPDVRRGDRHGNVNVRRRLRDPGTGGAQQENRGLPEPAPDVQGRRNRYNLQEGLFPLYQYGQPAVGSGGRSGQAAQNCQDRLAYRRLCRDNRGRLRLVFRSGRRALAEMLRRARFRIFRPTGSVARHTEGTAEDSGKDLIGEGVMKQWEDWIIFLGFWDEQYGDAVSAIGKWKESLAVSGLDGDDLRRLKERLFNCPAQIIYHSCCLALGSMRTSGDIIRADWIDGACLGILPAEYEKVKNRDFSDTYTYPSYYGNISVNFLSGSTHTVIGMTLDGKAVIDTFKEYGNEEARRDRIRELGYQRYSEEFLETVKKNYAKALLPPVPKGILKLPSSVRQGD